MKTSSKIYIAFTKLKAIIDKQKKKYKDFTFLENESNS